MTTSPISHSRHVVLVVDDDEQVLQTLNAILSRDGFDVLTARDAAQALTLVESTVPFIILSDVEMPGMTGFELCRRIKGDPRTAHVPVTLVTARVDSADVEEGIAAGATDYIKKPFDNDDVRMRVRLQIRLNEVLRAQRESEEKYRKLVEGLKSEYFFYRHDTNGVFTYVSPSIVHVLGHSPEEFCVHCETFLTDASVNRDAAHHTAQSTQGIQQPPYEVEIRHRDGSIRCLEVLESPVFEADNKVVAVDGIAHDITERIRAASDLRESTHLMESIVESVPLMIFLKEAQDLRFVVFNRAGEELLGYDRKDLIGKNNLDLFPPEQAAFFQAKDREVFAKEELVDIPEEPILTAKNGTRLLHTRKICVKGADGVARYLLGISEDITERKRIEAELGHVRKLEAVGQLAAGIAHEINTPTQFVGDSLSFLADSYKDIQSLFAKYREVMKVLASAPGFEALAQEMKELESTADLTYIQEHAPAAFARAADGVGRISAIVRSMKEFAHPDAREKCPADLNRALQNTLIIAKNEYKYVSDVETELGELPPVLCHVGDLNQVFLNLIVNAAHAIGDVVGKEGSRGKIRLRTLREGEWVRIDIADTGSGIPESVRQRIFEPFFTTKEVGKGSGQGLPIARSIVVDKHGGSLTFASEVGKGTTFTIRLPLDGKGTDRKDVPR